MAAKKARASLAPNEKTMVASEADVQLQGRSVREAFRKCGRPGCRVCANGPGHGPYLYVYWREDGKTKSKYLGRADVKALPDEPAAVQALRARMQAMYEVMEDMVVQWNAAFPGNPVPQPRIGTSAEKMRVLLDGLLEQWDVVHSDAPEGSPYVKMRKTLASMDELMKSEPVVLQSLTRRPKRR